jgi:hypothetical protein
VSRLLPKLYVDEVHEIPNCEKYVKIRSLVLGLFHEARNTWRNANTSKKYLKNGQTDISREDYCLLDITDYTALILFIATAVTT